MVEALVVAQVLSWLVILGLGLVVLALARQIGVLHERLAPLGALVTDRAADVGASAPAFEIAGIDGPRLRLGGRHDGARSQLLLFVAPECPMCKKLLPIVRSFRRAERHRLEVVLIGDGGADDHRALRREHGLEDVPLVIAPAVGMAYGVGKLPYAVLIDQHGTIRAKGLVNSREHLESLLMAEDTGYASIEQYMSTHLAAAAGPSGGRLN
jgi:methylamine dehydrogenase accessory protein MauD